MVQPSPLRHLTHATSQHSAETVIDIIEIFEFVLPDDNLYAMSGPLTYLISAFSSRNSSSKIKNLDNEFVTERSYEDGKDRKNKQIWLPLVRAE
jgi:hypothetical protein